VNKKDYLAVLRRKFNLSVFSLPYIALLNSGRKNIQFMLPFAECPYVFGSIIGAKPDCHLSPQSGFLFRLDIQCSESQASGGKIILKNQG
jgi:hypothetical protein